MSQQGAMYCEKYLLKPKKNIKRYPFHIYCMVKELQLEKTPWADNNKRE